MPIETVDGYEIEYEGALLPTHDGWGAYVTVYGHFHNPMHLTPLYPRNHVSLETIFPTKEEAEAEAHRVALELLHPHRIGA